MLSFLGLIFHSTMLRAIVIILVLGRSYASIAGSRFIPMWSFGRAVVQKLVCCLPFIRGPLFRFSFFWLVPCCYCPNRTNLSPHMDVMRTTVGGGWLWCWWLHSKIWLSSIFRPSFSDRPLSFSFTLVWAERRAALITIIITVTVAPNGSSKETSSAEQHSLRPLRVGGVGMLIGIGSSLCALDVPLLPFSGLLGGICGWVEGRWWKFFNEIWWIC